MSSSNSYSNIDKIADVVHRTATIEFWDRLVEQKMKFDYCISNPPYQDVSNRPIFQHFQTAALQMAKNCSMIYMATRWWYGTSGLAEYRDEILSHPKLSSVVYYNEEECSSSIFPGTGIAGGVCIVTFTDKHSRNEFILEEGGLGLRVTLPHGVEVVPIAASKTPLYRKIEDGLKRLNITSLNKNVHANLAQVTGAQLSTMHPTMIGDLNSNDVKNAVKAYTKSQKTYNSNTTTLVYANVSSSKGGRSAVYRVDTELHNLPLFKVCIGQSIIENEHRPLRLMLLPPEITFARSAVALAMFENEVEATNFVKYASTQFFEGCLRLTLGGRMRTLGSMTPDLKDYTSANPAFTPDNQLPDGHEYVGLTLDQRLQRLFGLSDDELALIYGDE